MLFKIMFDALGIFSFNSALDQVSLRSDFRVGRSLPRR